jgi:WD40-like Beta Propeller Repeat
MVAIFGLILLVLLFLSFALETRAPESAPVTTRAADGRIAYFEFGINADTLWLASASNPGDRASAFVIPHAPEYGAVPSLAPLGSKVAYTALAPETPAPGPDAPADLWLASLSGNVETRLVASGVDLLVAPVWSPDADSLVFRRSDASGFSLIEMPAGGGAEDVLVASSAYDALFPVGFTPDGATLYYVALSEQGSRLRAVDVATGQETSIALLSDGLSREWTLSPDGTQLAYLALTQTQDAINSRAYVVDLATSAIEAVSDLAVSAFGPVWDAQGGLTVGTVSRDGEGSLVELRDGKTSQVLGPEGGFDVPLASMPDGGLLVRAFEGASASTPGHATLTMIDAKGKRHALTSRETTLVGWSTP